MKFRHVVAAVSAAAAIALVPTAAFAYGAGDYSNKGTVSTTSPTLGTPFTVTVQGPANTSVTLTITSNPTSIPDSAIQIAGTKSLAKVTNTSGVATFTVTLSQPGTFTLVTTDTASGAVLSTQAVSVAGTTTSASGSLASTGADILPYALGGGALVLVGAGAVIVARRRSAHAA